MKNNYRVLSFYNLRFGARSSKYASLDPYPSDKYFGWLRAAYKEKSTYVFSSGKAAYYIQDLQETDQSIVLLVKFIDGLSRDHSIEDMETHELTEFTKSETQGDVFTSHIWIEKTGSKSKHKMIVEVNTGFTIGKLSSMFSGLFKAYLATHKIEVKVPDPSGEIKNNKQVMIQKWPTAEARGSLSSSFVKDLEESEISDVFLISSQCEGAVNLEGVRTLRAEKATVKLKIIGKKKFLSLAELKSIGKGNRKKYDEIAVSYVHADEKQITAKFECNEDLSPLNVDRLVKKVIVDANSAVVSNAYTRIQTEVVKAIEKHKND